MEGKNKMLTIEEQYKKAKTSPALNYQHKGKPRESYPANYFGKVPLKVKMATEVKPDPIFLLGEALGIEPDRICLKEGEYFVWVNSYGAVSSILPNGNTLGLLPSEFVVTEWHETELKNQMQSNSHD